jgi:hypothetical protein
MKRLFWLAAGMGLGVAGYRYYQQNGNRLPILDQLMGGRTDEIVDQASAGLHDLKKKGQAAVNEQVGGATRQAVAAVAEEIADAERAKHREDSRTKLS